MKETHIREILSDLGVSVVVTNSSGWVVCHCPFAPHGYHRQGADRNPSFFVKVNACGATGYNCQACHQSGNILQLVSKLEGLNGVVASRILPKAMLYASEIEFGEYAGIPEDYQPPEALDEGMFASIYPPIFGFTSAMDYLAEREVSEEAAEIMDLRFDPDGLRILFPVRGSEGELYGFSGRSILPDEIRRMAKVKDYSGLKKKHCLLGEHLAQGEGDTRPFLVVEGLFAYARMITLGTLDWVVPVCTLASYMSEQQAEILSAWGRPVYMLYDDDEAGRAGMWGKLDSEGKHKGDGAIGKLTKAGLAVHVCRYPERFAEGEGDPDLLTADDVFWILSHGSEQVL